MDDASIDNRVVAIIGAGFGISTSVQPRQMFAEEVKLDNIKTETRYAFEDWRGTQRRHERRNRQTASKARIWKTQRR